jgi:predicted MFS family arabinose efflux permease
MPELARWGLLSLSAAAAVTLLTELLPTGVLLPMSASLAVPPGRIGFLAGVFALASTGSAIPFTSLTRGFGRRELLVGLLLALAVANLATAASSSYLLTVGIRLAAGLVNGMLWSMVASCAARMVAPEQRGRAIAITLAGITVTLAAGVPAGTALAGAIGWRPTFAVLSALALLVALWIRLAVPVIPGEPARTRIGPARVLRMPGIGPVLVVNGLLLLGHQAMYTYLAPFSGRTPVSLVLLVFGVASVLGIWLAGALADRRLRAGLLGTLGLITAAMLGLGLWALELRGPDLWGLELRGPELWASDRAGLLVAVALWGLAFGAAPTLLQTALILCSGPERADVASSIQTTVYNAGIAGGALIGEAVLGGPGAGALPWVALPLVAGALVVAARIRALAPADERDAVSLESL